jgi:hypothetical protein
VTELDDPRKTECPGCESPQLFPLRKEPDPELEGVIRVYLRCTKCTWHRFVGFTTDEIEKQRTVFAKVAARAAFEEKRHNQVSFTTQQSLIRVRGRRNNMVADLQRRLKERGIDERRVRTAAAK